MLNELSNQVYLDNLVKPEYKDNQELLETLRQSKNIKAVESLRKLVAMQKLALIASKIHPISEAIKNKKMFTIRPEWEGYDYKERIENASDSDVIYRHLQDMQNTLEDEISDMLLLVLDFCGFYSVDIDFHMKIKRRINNLGSAKTQEDLIREYHDNRRKSI